MTSNAIRHDSIGLLDVTFYHDGSIVFDPFAEFGSDQAGLAVTVKSDDTVGLATTGDSPIYKLNHVEFGGVCSVQVRGFSKLPAGDGATFTLGEGVVGAQLAGADGYINGDGAGHGCVFNSADSSEIKVFLG